MIYAATRQEVEARRKAFIRKLSMGTVVSAIVGVELSLVDGLAFGR
jgi:hypothetical protein